MKIRDFVQQQMVLLLVQPFSKEKQVEYKSSLKKATRILVLFPGSELPWLEKTLFSAKSIFPDAAFTVLYTGNAEFRIKKQTDVTLENLLLSKETYWTLSRSKRLNPFVKKRFDILLDLNPEYSLLGIYLCRLIRAPIRIGLDKSQSEKFYNFIYRGKTEATYAEKVAGLVQFLRSFTTR